MRGLSWAVSLVEARRSCDTEPVELLAIEAEDAGGTALGLLNSALMSRRSSLV
ncbi:MAG: hypothetical protein BMS9Abin12_2129 [Acidimicrobiia bacterium]|nr:MAG: hypothetical protein BMS9Abin12_2129 [Acidimicrobiia bacterium]